MKEHVKLRLEELDGARTGACVCYVSTPITPGRLGYELLDRLGLSDCKAADSAEPGRWRREVIEPNERRAREWAATLAAHSEFDVINPAEVTEPGWSQDCYDQLWAGVITRYRPTLSPAPDWAFSRGARHEVRLALRLGLHFVDECARPTSRESIVAQWRAADAIVAARGWARYGAPLPALDLSADLVSLT